jgi:hypothetical protein
VPGGEERLAHGVMSIWLNAESTIFTSMVWSPFL